MGWRTVVVTQHAKISYSGHCVVVQTADSINQIPVSDIQILLVSTTRAVITSAVISELAKHQSKVIFTDNSGQPVTETVDYYPNNRDPQLLNTQFNWSEKRKTDLWTKIVVQKIANQIFVVDSLGIESQELKDELSKLEVNDVTNREAVVARKYFSLLFEDEASRRDFSPTNAALNYGYAIILSAVNREIVANGYITQLGIHHHSQENNFNLGSDLMEPFRPIIDWWVKQKKFNDFTPDIKFGLVGLLDLQMKYNGQNTIMRNAISKHVLNCLKYLSEETDKIKIEVEISEVSNNAINGNV
ncbi:type II CRISPR-associated endonuclease Cas1 [Pediococcus parvulus]|uniref:CRISPR-associated endonuclease Cas1 n=1 Tax=Pediococcus parvulus TaxID=54062 RepID=A0A176TL38_9LACO|nr:type II CRISPR-associated endonuclease Cas1 [Pediococcus parvulus]MCT3027041.1 type II CRISPR-associated endonuclease Cas1 [Pediococcus parvulus]MCT3031189.1 type II CRISPR-associated endonuclease Cas1 [Pediococcus parvulus]MDV7694136.1 type II CRISPR-associated endonuclease Cas1 [Pediococcus parvulus]OAD64683.1 subtype II CRISPR-associated endonuclease Cas1 [Pediococcus parvulus]GEL89602.1 CRISPR-associated endonuclease Cas1 [Pediococcus parvulus]